MTDIKKKEEIKRTIKTFNKSVVATQKTKDNIVNVKNKSETATNTEEKNANEYATNKINRAGRVVVDNYGKIKQKGNQSLKNTKDNFIKTKAKIKNIKTKLSEKRKIKDTIKGIKTGKQLANNTRMITKESVKGTQKAMKISKESIKKTYQGVKFTLKATISSVKAIIAASKALIGAIIAGGWVVIVIIIVICLVGLLCSSIFGIFFSGEKLSSNSMTMRDAITECNQEFSDKLESIQESNPHDDYVLDGSMASWKDVLLVYTIKLSNGTNEQEVITMDNNKKNILKDIFWSMNDITSEVKDEIVIEQGVNDQEMPKEVEKKVLHIKIISKTAEEMKTKYNFNSNQLKQYNELASGNYAMLWNNVIYGIDSSEYISWRQYGATWSNIKIGSTNSTISNIGCLITSIAILIQKSEVNTTNIVPFNPGTFVQELNKNGGFDANGNLQYAGINKVVPDFQYVDNINLRDKSKSEKLELITKYYNDGYYLTVEVKGATPGNQHWVAVIGIDGNNIIMVDPATNHTDMWSAYEWSKTSQFSYFKAN